MSPSESARRFFQGAMSIWLGAPEFQGAPVSRSLDEWFELSLREHLPDIARKRGADHYIRQLEAQVDRAFQFYAAGKAEEGRNAMVELLDLIHSHLHLPSTREVANLVEKARGVH
jgi:hypothetical protein